ncbi:hypothetical protein LKD72_16155 [Fusicatenibacter sp. CLA-AA-H213]|nr:hypothetical protein [Fusicatenibacter sp. CLA-AA-H213]
MSKYKEEEETNILYLDSLDLDRFVEVSNDVGTIMDAIREVFDDSPGLPAELQGCIFNCVGEEKFAYYLAKRYGKRVQEEVRYILR